MLIVAMSPKQHIFLALQKKLCTISAEQMSFEKSKQNSQTFLAFYVLNHSRQKKSQHSKIKQNFITKLARSSVRNTKKYVVSALTSPAVSQKQYLAPHPLAWSLTPWGPSRAESSPRHLALGADLIMPSPSVIYPHQHMASLVTMTRNRYPNHTATG